MWKIADLATSEFGGNLADALSVNFLHLLDFTRVKAAPDIDGIASCRQPKSAKARSRPDSRFGLTGIASSSHQDQGKP